MGATSWLYFVPYQEDVEAALQALRRDVFLRGDYAAPIDRETMIAALQQALRRPKCYDADLVAQWKEDLERLESIPEADPDDVEAAIGELLAVNREAGTHSILDIRSTSSTPGFGVAAPLSAAQLTQLFGTQKPMHHMVKARRAEIEVLRDRWEATFIIVYQDGEPDEIAFIGYSGDWGNRSDTGVF